MQEAGYVAALLYSEGAKDVELGKIVAILVENKSDISAFKDYSPDSATATKKEAAAAPTSAPAQAASP